MKTLPKKIATKITGLFYKEIVSDKNKVIDKVYLIRYRDINGRDKLQTIGKYSKGIREAYCKTVLDEIQHKVKTGDLLPTVARAKSNLTFDDVTNMYFDEKLEDGTLRDAEKERARYNNHLSKLIGKYLPVNITDDVVKDVEKKLRKYLSLATVKNLIFQIAGIYKYASTIDILKGTLPQLSKVKFEKMNNSRDRYLELNEIQQLLTKSYEVNYDVWLFVKLSLSTGGRLNTVLNIKKKDINLAQSVIRLHDLKNKGVYNGYICDSELKEALTKRMKSINMNDKIVPCSVTFLAIRLRPILNDLFNVGLDKDDRASRTVIHSLRHTFASHLVINGTPLVYVQKLMHHNTIQMTERYSHLAPTSGSDAVFKLYKEK